MVQSFFTESQLNKSQKRTFWALLITFGTFLGLGLANEAWIIAGLPFFFFGALLLIFHLDFIFFLSVFITPLSINLAGTSLGIGMSLPSEPVMFILFLLYSLHVVASRGLPRNILYHPVTLAIFLHLGWFIVTTATSSMPIVSIKYTLARLCFVAVFYFFLLHQLSRRQNIHKFLWVYTIPLILVIFYTIINHSLEGFSQDAAHTAMVPFYNDHTAYAAVISFFVPVMISFLIDRTSSTLSRMAAGATLVILLTAIVLSYTRAAWVGLAGALGCYFIFLLRIRSWVVYMGFVTLFLVAYSLGNEITMQLEQNEKVSSDEYADHMKSIGNINSDDSNVERLNRWACALRMFEKKPIFGYGPGTYMFQYGAFQKFSQRSGISTNFAEGGGSHSEFLGPLSEQGIMGPFTYSLIIVVVAQTTANFIKRTKNKSDKILAKGVLLGLVTYWVHGVLNFFLDTEKLSVPFWGFIAILVALQIYSNPDGKANSGNAPAGQ